MAEKRPMEAGPGRRELIEFALSQGRNAMAIWQDLVDHHHFSASYQSVRRFAGKLQAATLKPEWSSRLRPAKNPRSTTAPARWSVMRRPVSIAVPGCLC